MKTVLFNLICLLFIGFLVYVATIIPADNMTYFIIGFFIVMLALAMSINNNIENIDKSHSLWGDIKVTAKYFYDNGQAIIGIIVLLFLAIAVLVLLEAGIESI
jgi:hypothetical protein